jgi:hypothetical protein
MIPPYCVKHCSTIEHQAARVACVIVLQLRMSAATNIHCAHAPDDHIGIVSMVMLW